MRTSRLLLAGLAVSPSPLRRRLRPAARADAVAARRAGRAAASTAFRSDAELRAYLRRLQAAGARPRRPSRRQPPPPRPCRRRRRRRRGRAPGRRSSPTAARSGARSPPSARRASPTTRKPASTRATSSRCAASILVILRRGRLFTVSLAGGGMRPVDSIDAFPPGVSGARRLV